VTTSDTVKGREGRGTFRHGSSFTVQVYVLTLWSVRAWITDRAAVLLGTVQPVVILFVLTGVFGDAEIARDLPPGTTYFDFVFPAVLVGNAVQTSLQSGVGLVEDLRNGIVGRMRSLPIRMSSLLVARANDCLVRSVVQISVIFVVAFTMLGYSPRAGLGALALSVGVTLLIGWGLGWVFLALGAWLRKAELMQNLSITLVLPLMFASSAYVPVSQLPSWLQYVALANPLTYAVDACRALAFADPQWATTVVSAVVVSLVLALAGFAGAVRGLRRPV